MNIGQRVRALRGTTISTKEVDKLAGLTAGVTWSLEDSDSNNAQTKTLTPIAEIFGVSLDYLIRGDGLEPSREELDAAIALARARYESRRGRKATGTDGAR